MFIDRILAYYLVGGVPLRTVDLCLNFLFFFLFNLDYLVKETLEAGNVIEKTLFLIINLQVQSGGV